MLFHIFMSAYKGLWFLWQFSFHYFYLTNIQKYFNTSLSKDKEDS